MASPPAIGSGSPGTGAFTSLISTSGALNGSVGATTPSTGAFTTLSASSTVSGTGFSNYLASPPAIGGTTPAAVSSTTLTHSQQERDTSYVVSVPTTGWTNCDDCERY
ncbi:hypothetical protein [Paraburkholderia sediminicola]|uniref:hypothetical protein n=1 Tax=Paraburkholderia sediminicola TaxID=458836 RepID=UPI0038B83DBA